MKHCSRIVASLLLGAALIAGCTNSEPSRAGGTTRYRQITGTLSTTVEAPLDRVWGAAQGAVEDLEFRSTSKNKDALTGILKTKTADNSDIEIRLDQRTENTTDISINVGPFGSEATARLVLDKITSRL